MTTMHDTDAHAPIRALADSEIAEVNGGLLGIILYVGYSIAVGVAAALATSGGGSGGSAPGDYPTGPKNTA